MQFPGDEEYESEYINFYENFIKTEEEVSV